MRNNIRVRYITDTNVIEMSIKCGGVNEMFRHQIPVVGTEFARRHTLVREQAMRDIAKNQAIEWSQHPTDYPYPLDWPFHNADGTPFTPAFSAFNTNIEV